MSSIRNFFTGCIISSELCVSRLAHARATYTHSAAIKTYLLPGIFPFYFYRDTLVSFTRMDKSVATTRLRVRKIGYTTLSAPLSQMITKSKFYIEAEIRLPRFSVIGVELPREKRGFQIFLWSRKVRVDGWTMMRSLVRFIPCSCSIDFFLSKLLESSWKRRLVSTPTLRVSPPSNRFLAAIRIHFSTVSTQENVPVNRSLR